MKELGEYLKTTRKSNGVSISEAAEDLELSTSQLENIESGNVRAFKDVYDLKGYIKQYAKYLGLDCEKVVDEFNGFLFEHTSKISLDDIRAAQKKREESEKKVRSPYTKIYKPKKKIWPIITVSILFIVLLCVVFYLIINFHINKTPNRIDELCGKHKEDIYYEFTY